MLAAVRVVAQTVPLQSHSFDLQGLDPYRPLVDEDHGEVHEQIDALLDNLTGEVFSAVETWAKQIASQGKETSLQYVRAIVPRLLAMDIASEAMWESASKQQQLRLANDNLRPRALRVAVGALMRRRLDFTDDDLLGLLEWFDSYESMGVDNGPIAAVLRNISKRFGSAPLPPEFRKRLERILAAFDEPSAADRKAMAQIKSLLDS